MNRFTPLKAFSLVGVLLLLSGWIFGQAISGDITGVVKDSSGAVVPNATVTVTNLGTNYKQETTTNASGEYRFFNLPAAHYSLQAVSGSLKGGFADVTVELNKTSTFNITASVAAAATTVEVSESAATVNTTSPQIETTFNTKELADSPMASTGSGVLNLSLLNAGVASSGGIAAGSGPSVSGQRPRNNNFTVEGVDNNNKSVTGPLLQIPNDAVDSFTVLQNQFSPEFGHSSGGQFNQTIKSGTNQFHGRAWEYFQNRNLNAQDSLVAASQIANGENPHNTRFDDNRFGGQIGGPIIKNKLFFFTMWQYEPIGFAGGASTACAPTAAGYATLSGLPGIAPNNLSTFQKYAGTAGSIAGTGPTEVCPQSSTVLGQSIPIGDVGFIGPSYQNYLTNVNSGDWNISSKDSLRVRYAFENFTGFDTAAQVSAFWLTTPTKYNLFTLGEYHNFTPNLNNEFRFGFNRYYNNTPSGSLTFPGLNVFPNLTIDEFNGMNIGPDPNAPQFTYQNTYQAIDNISWTKGKHNLKFGATWGESISPQSFTQRERGDYEYGTFENYLLDQVPSTFAERSMGSFTYYGNQQYFYAYGNDEWRVTPTLTLSLGLRYELTTVPLSQTQAQPLNAESSVPGLITFGAPQKQTKNFLPRFGFAWAPGNGNTSIRGGFGMAVDVLYDNLGILSMPPQVQQTCDGGLDPSQFPMSAGCYWSNTAFLANGGLPSNQPGAMDPATARLNTAAYIPNQKLPYSETWNFGVQHVFAQKYTLDVRYVGTRGIHLPVQQRLNRQDQSSFYSGQYLPVFTSAPSQAYLDSLTNTYSSIAANPSYVPAYDAAGFNGASVVGFMYWGASNYNGLQTQLTRSFTNGLQFIAAWTWSHAFDNSTADVFSTYLTPRRPQDFQCYACDWSTSALDRRHRVTFGGTWDMPYFKHDSNWFMKNVLGNWQWNGNYIFESPEYATVQANTDINGNGDAAGDRVFYNAAGIPGTGTGSTALCNSALPTGVSCGDRASRPFIVGYLADSSTAQYITPGKYGLVNTPRNTLALPHMNNFNLGIMKRVNITERQAIEFQAQATNIFNHAQYVPGYISDIQPASGAITTGGPTHSILIPTDPSFNQPASAFSNHPRAMVLVLKYDF